MKRRDFLKGCMLCGAASSLGLPAKKAWGSGSFEGYSEGMGVLVDLTRCIGCRSCEAACNKEQKLPEPKIPFDDQSVFEEKRRPTEEAYTVVNRYENQGGPVYRKIQCNHCNEPACLTSCFVNAYTKTKEGAVIYNPKICVGCRNCMIACPFNVPGYSYSSATNPVVKKCIFCYDTRVKYGKPPACVEVCPQEVLTFGYRKDLIKMGHERIRETPDKYVDHIYGEKELGGTGWLYLSGVPFDKVGFDTTLGNEPIISNVKEFLGTVPMVLAIWPALFTGFHLLSTRKKEHEEEHGHDHPKSSQEDSDNEKI
ncbi:menaquinol oxidoreductase complex Cbc7, iron-sulfur cluster-binding subunit, putative [Geotalea daltonii FRC-32]|uniref:Menaquinol oxidoreductase complex Cbc7, iron-sulfur cluster-binding subunit, putative n=1 Tax=Geotalea daltonii (strain DSM 22248 / JCM 15807 / FRC-32) TaxID=316067 RepID=B9M5X0_GEODF|nr:4Fe-4S dicluster domain-containing protein [Geotalea daltonii]ACM19951.1 menaquinol oxidoreductase complex Cbc7, iron-sulfur cluster-binding subunit, putative [Geotalea daltonii FRC-32]